MEELDDMIKKTPLLLKPVDLMTEKKKSSDENDGFSSIVKDASKITPCKIWLDVFKGYFNTVLYFAIKMCRYLFESQVSSLYIEKNYEKNNKWIFSRYMEYTLNSWFKSLILIVFQSHCKIGRSMSDGDLKTEENGGSLDVFSKFSVLEKFGIKRDGLSLREHLSEEELEQKFTSLALAFTIDTTTINDRCERQRRSRDQTEANLSKEILKFKEKLALMQPLCIDYEKVELLSSLTSQIDVIMKATSLVSISAEKFGSVQQEERLTDSVKLMVNHVQMLKQQRDSARKQLQYTKRVLRNSPDSPTGNPISQKSPLLNLNTPNRKIICRRRASIASITQPLIESTQMPSECQKVLKRNSELSMRSTPSGRIPRPNRLELGVDLVEIKEGLLEPLSDIEQPPEIKPETDMEPTISRHEEFQPTIGVTKLSLREKLQFKFHRARSVMEEKYSKWTDDGTIHEIFSFCALMCFSLSVIIMANILIEFEYAKRELGASHFFWIWPTKTNQKFSRTRH